MAKSCLMARGDHVVFLAVCTVLVDGEFEGDFGGGFYVVVLWGSFEE